MNYKFAISCREPLINVTGGIGTYTRLLVELITKCSGDCVIFVPDELGEAEGIKKIIPEIEVVKVKMLEKFPNNLNSEAFKWSYSLYKAIEIFEKSNTISLFEFPDYEAEGFFAINAAKFGLVSFKTCVRLHSPIFMLKTDNNNDLMYIDDERIVAAEKSCLLFADMIFYGADKMKDRVYSYFSHNQIITLKQKSVKIHHPSAKKTNKCGIRRKKDSQINLGTIGRLEWRKGQDIVVRASSNFKCIGNLEITLYGGDTNTCPNGGSYGDYLKEILLKDENKIVNLAGKLSQENLWIRIQNDVDAFVFPSRFENYPNALLEVIELGLPIAVSSNGGMPEILRLNKYENWIEFDPTPEGAVSAIKWLVKTAQTYEKPNIIDHSEDINKKIIDIYKNIIDESSAKSPVVVNKEKKSITIVVPHYNQSALVDDLIKCGFEIQEKDINLEILIVDDGSTNEEIINLENKAKNYSFLKINKSNANAKLGPAKLRYLGACEAKNDIVLFCDADDYISVDFVYDALLALHVDPSVEYCIAPHKAFGLENYDWMPSPASAITIMWENYTNCGIIIRKNKLQKKWFFVDYDVSEDWYTSAMIFLNLNNYIIYPKTGYFYRRIGNSRSTQNINFIKSAEKLVRFDLIRSCIESGKLNSIHIESIFRSAIFENPINIISSDNKSIKKCIRQMVIIILERIGIKKSIKNYLDLFFRRV